MLIPIIDWVQRNLHIAPSTQLRLLVSILLVIFLYVFRILVIRIVYKRTEDIKLRYHWRKLTSYLAFFIGAIVLFKIWVGGIKNIATFLGLLSAGIAIALRDPISNIAGWLFILWRKPFEVGDRIQIGEHRGDVIDIRVFQFTLMEIGNWVPAEQSTGRILHIPNSRVFTEEIANYDKGFKYIWNEIPVVVTFESNWKKAKEILLEIARRHAEHLTKDAEEKLRRAARKYMIFYTVLTPTVYTSVVDNGVMLSIRYLTLPRKRRNTEQAIWEEILEAFHKEDDIDFAYPTQRMFLNYVEGKIKKEKRE